MILYYSIIIQQISTVKKSSANLCQCCSLHQWRAGQAHCDCGGSVHQHRGCSRSVGRGNPSVASPSPSESPHRSESWGVMGRHRASWGVMGCQIVSGSSNFVLRLVSLCFIQELNCRICESTFVCFRMFGELALRLRLRLKPAVCNMAGCWQHAMAAWRFLSLRRCGVLNLICLCLQEIQ